MQIVVTGAAGFIGCNLARRLNADGFSNLILVDDFTENKESNLEGVSFAEKIHRDNFIEWLTENSEDVKFVFHLPMILFSYLDKSSITSLLIHIDFFEPY